MTRQQYRVLCLALLDYRQQLEDAVHRCRYALDQTVGLNVSKMDYRERIAEKLVVYEQRMKLVDEVIVEVANIYDER